MKKPIKIFLATLFSTISSGTVSACVNPFLDDNVFRITIVTDGHTITDQSFNQSVYEGVLAFSKEFSQWQNDPLSTAPANLRNKKLDVKIIQPPTVEHNVLRQSYNQALILNNQVVITNGAIQTDALVATQNDSRWNSKMRFVSVDVDTKDRIPYKNKNLAGLLFQSEQAGLLAAVASGAWLLAHSEEYQEQNRLRMSTYGGIDIPAVTSWMYGFYWGIELLNNAEKYSPTFNQELKSWIKKLNPAFDERSQLPKIDFVEVGTQFTGSFNQGSSGSKALNDKLAQKHTNVIFPVAGPQIADTFDSSEKIFKKIWVVGVDTDQQLQFPEIKKFLTSGVKNIPAAVVDVLWAWLGYDATQQHQKLPDGEQDKIFKDKDVYRGGLEFIGIANNKPINLIYSDIINSKELEIFAKKISVGWQEILNKNKDKFWIAAKKINPFN